jgi:hypothetical protein
MRHARSVLKIQARPVLAQVSGNTFACAIAAKERKRRSLQYATAYFCPALNHILRLHIYDFCHHVLALAYNQQLPSKTHATTNVLSSCLAAV